MDRSAEAAIALAPARRRRKRPRIAQLLATAGVGGAQESAISLLLHLDRSRFEVEAICLTDGAAVRRLRGLGIPVTVIDGDDREATAALATYLRQREIDLLHAHLFRAELVGAAAARRARTPVVVATVHSSRVRSASDVAALAAATPTFDRLIAPSVSIAAKVRREGRGAAEITVIPNGVDVERFAVARDRGLATRDRLGIPADAFLLGLVARLEPEKGHHVLVRAFPAIVAAVPKAWLLLVGEGSQADALRAHVDALPARARRRVVFGGPRRDVASVLAAMDLAVFPSLREAQGLAVLEAMAAGIPVVASAVGGIPETIRNGIEGVLVPPDQPVALEIAIARLAHHHRLRRRLALAGHRRVVEEFSAAASVRKVESVYLEELTRAGILAPRPTHAAFQATRPVDRPR